MHRLVTKRWLAILALVLFCCYSHGLAWGANGWSEPQVIFSTANDLHVSAVAPTIAVDSSGELHVFWAAQNLPGEDAIYYAHGDGETWSSPIEVVIGPRLSIPNSRPVAVIDSQGYIHLFWINGEIYYSKAHVTQAERAQQWRRPVNVSLGDNGISPFVYLDQNGVLHLAYAAISAHHDAYYTRSVDGGLNWSRPVNVSVIDVDENASDTVLAVDAAGRIHMVWSQSKLPTGWPPRGLYYAVSEDDGETWSVPMQLAGDWEGNGAIISASDGKLHVVWCGTGERSGRYYRWSLDGGATWSSVVELTRTFGSLGVGVVQLLQDSAGELYWCTQGYDLQSQGDRLRCSVWDRDKEAWMQPVRVTDTDLTEEAPWMAISGGNRLHLVWQQTDDLAGTRQIVYAHYDTGAPAQPFLPVATPLTLDVQMPTSQPISSPQANSTLLPTLRGQMDEDGNVIDADASTVILVSVLPVLVLILAVLVIALAKKS